MKDTAAFILVAAQENIKCAAEVRFVIVCREPKGQITVQRQCVNAELYCIEIFHHCPGQVFPAVKRSFRSKPVRLPIDEIEFSTAFENKVDKAFHEPLRRKKFQTSDRFRNVLFFKQFLQLPRRTEIDWKSEFQFVDSRGNIAEGETRGCKGRCEYTRKGVEHDLIEAVDVKLLQLLSNKELPSGAIAK